MQLHKITSQSDKVSVSFVEPNPAGQPDYTTVVISIEDAGAWMRLLQSASDAARRERVLIEQRREQDLLHQEQLLLQQLHDLQEQLRARRPDEDRPTLAVDPDGGRIVPPEIARLIVCEGPVRAGPPTARLQPARGS